MKPFFKFLLTLLILLAGLYAASPIWIPLFLARQLPPGWQLEKVETGYPDISGMDIRELRVNGEFLAAKLAISARDIRYGFTALKTDITSLSIDIYMHGKPNSTAESMTLDDFSLPVMRLSGKMPEVSVDQLHVALHQADVTKPGNKVAGPPLTLDFKSLDLQPRSDNSFNFSTRLNIKGDPDGNGQLDAEVNTDSFKADIRFPADDSEPAWLSVSLQQNVRALETTTRLHAVFDSGSARRQWLDRIVHGLSAGMVTNVSGRLETSIDFSGEDLQKITQLSVTAEQFQAELVDGSLLVDTSLQANRAGEALQVILPASARIQYLPGSGQLDALLASALPELQRSPLPFESAKVEIKPASSFVLHPGASPAMKFKGNLSVGLFSADSNIGLEATELEVEINDLAQPDTATGDGNIEFSWSERAALIYTSGELVLKAGGMSLAGQGHLLLDGQTLDLSQGNFNSQFTKLQTQLKTGQEWLGFDSDTYVMKGQMEFDQLVSTPASAPNFYFKGTVNSNNAMIMLPGDERSPPTRINATELSIDTDLRSRAGQLVSTGSGRFLNFNSSPPASSARQVDLSWQQLDLPGLSGELSTRTQGFATEAEGESWTGFDFDTRYSLQNKVNIDGSGMVIFDAGTNLPIEFSGNTQTGHWNIKLPASTIKLEQLDDLLDVAHFELPAAVSLSNGFIDLQGNLIVNDDLVGTMLVRGYELDASMLKSNAHDASFRLETNYAAAVSARGPVQINSLALAGGIDVTQIRTDLDISDMNSFALRDLQAGIFDGQLNLKSLQYSENRIEDTTIEFSDINLGHLLAFADVDGLEGTGRLGIVLPAGSDETGIFVKNGTFNANGSGRLAYTKEGVAGSNIGLQALENFQYEKLSGTVNYQSDGSYELSVHLEGMNPDLYGGHPIVFNLSISGILPALFEALFITGDFEESILQEIKRR